MTTKQHVVRLSATERQELGQLLTRTGASAHTQRRARILLHADTGVTGPRLTDVEIAAAVAVDPRTVARTRSQYAREGVAATVTRVPRGDQRPRKLEGETAARLVALVCSAPPLGQARWSLRLLSQTLVALEIVESVSPETVRLALKKTGSSHGR